MIRRLLAATILALVLVAAPSAQTDAPVRTFEVRDGEVYLDGRHLPLVAVLSTNVIEAFQTDTFDLDDRGGPGGLGGDQRGTFGKVRPTMFELAPDDVLVLDREERFHGGHPRPTP